MSVELKPGRESSEHKMAWVGVFASALVAVVPVVLERVPEESTVALVLGCLGAMAATILGYGGFRTYAKSKELAAKGLLEAQKLPESED